MKLNEKSARLTDIFQCHTLHSIFWSLYFFFFRQHHSSKCRDFTLGCDWKGCFMDYFDYRNWNYYNDTSFESIEQAPIADYNKATSLKPKNQD